MADLRYPDGLKYSKEHEWVKLEGNVAVIGITDFAQEQLGDVVFVELPSAGRVLKQFEQFGVVESVKTVSDLYCPISGKVIEVNAALENEPELVNQGPYDKGWMIKVEMANPTDLENLLDAAAYAHFVKGA
jgi:glycine cleavage system H protein